jgi:hypothetical protein
MRTRALVLSSAIAGSLSLLGASVANAATTVELGIGSTPVTEATSSGGTATYTTTSYPGYSSITISGTGAPPLTLPALLDSSTIDAVSSMLGGGVVDIWVTEIGLTASVPGFSSSLILNGGSSVSITENTFYSATNNPFATTVELASETISPGGSMTIPTVQSSGSGPYSITEEYVINLGPGQNVNADIDIDATPIPGTLPLFASGLFGFWAWSRKRKRTVKLLGGPSLA